ncbi:MAG: TraR/DksA C4-type zinc finger protein [Aquisalimonadaceae bacterium]
MPDDAELHAFRQRLENDLAMLEGDADYRRSSTEPVELDQTRTGRLSRMDALQGQAMARATEARAGQQVLRIRAALRRLEEGAYGDCVRCEEPIAPGRLQADPAVAICIDCAEKAEKR